MISPYRLFFPLGLFYIIWGLFIWIALWLGMPVENAIQAHGEIMMGGFMFSFIAGFLLTATPKYTGSFEVKPWQLRIFLIIQMFFIVSITINSIPIFHILELFAYFLLLYFVFERFINRRNHLYPYYIFLLIGLSMAVLSLSIIVINDFYTVDNVLLNFSKGFFYEGMVIAIILGVGSSLLPTIMGYRGQTVLQLSIVKDSKKFTDNFFKSVSRLMWLVIFVFIISFFFEYFIDYKIARLVRTCIIFIVINDKIKLFKSNPVKNYMSKSIWISLWLLVLSQFFLVFFEAFKIHLLHMTFISSFALITLMIASRISLAHGAHGFSLEVNSKVYYWIFSLIVLSAITRVTAVFMPAIYISHLAYAAFTMLVAVILWAIYFLPKIIVLNR